MPGSDNQGIPVSEDRQAVRFAGLISTRYFKFICFVLAAALSTIVLWMLRAPVLQWATDSWVVSDPVEPADAVAVLGGGLQTRPFASADLYNAGLVKTILILTPKPNRLEREGIVASHVDLNRAVLRKKGVPESAIVVIETEVQNTRDEAMAVRGWLQASGARKIIVVTETFPSRRTQWVFNKTLSSMGAKVIVDPVPEVDFDYRRWWEDERGIVAFQNEVLKYAYYRLKY